MASQAAVFAQILSPDRLAEVLIDQGELQYGDQQAHEYGGTSLSAVHAKVWHAGIGTEQNGRDA